MRKHAETAGPLLAIAKKRRLSKTEMWNAGIDLDFGKKKTNAADISRGVVTLTGAGQSVWKKKKKQENVFIFLSQSAATGYTYKKK